MHLEGLMEAQETKDKRGIASGIEANDQALLGLLKVP
jgi:hypothetical protein